MLFGIGQKQTFSKSHFFFYVFLNKVIKNKKKMKILFVCFFFFNLFLFSQGAVRLYSVYFNDLTQNTELRELNPQTGNFSFIFSFNQTYGIPAGDTDPYYDDMGKEKETKNYLII
jgi:hypothetical protein